MRIRNRLLLLVLAVLVPAFAAAALAIAYVYHEEQEAQNRSVSETARAFALLVDNEIRTHAGMLRTLAAAPSLARGDLRDFYEHARGTAPTPASTVILLAPDGRQLLNTRRPFGAELPLRRISNLPELMRRYGQDRILVSDLYTSQVGGHHDFTIQVPVRIGGSLRYFLVMGVNAATLQRLMRQQRFSSTWIASVVDRKGIILARSREHDGFLGRPVRSASQMRLAGAREGMFAGRNLAGVRVRAFFSTVPLSDWKILISIPDSELRRSALQASALLAGLMVLMLAGGLLAAGWLARRVIQPIEQLGRSAEELGQGKAPAYRAHGIEEIDAVAGRMHEAGREIGRSRDELEERVTEAVAATERVQGALLKAQKLEALGRLTGGIAHEFNNLLQTLTTALQLAEMTATQPKIQSLVQTCKKTVQRATALTGQLGSFGRIQEARQETVDSGEQLRSALQLMKGALREDIALEVEQDPGEDAAPWPVTIEPLQFDLALLNLAINARDAMPAGGRLRIGLRKLAQAQPPGGLPRGDYVCVSVSDNGTGMAPEVLARALDPFFTTRAQGQGTGLGLAQAYAFATQSQGTLVIDSKEGEGTRVEIWLPRAAAPAQAGPVQHQGQAPTRAPAAPLRRARARVLFVEDDALVREAVLHALEESGFDVLVAHNGEDAVQLLDKGEVPQVVFSDIVMPGKISGIDLAGIVRRRYPHIPVVLATGYTEQQAGIPGMQVLAKPYPIERLVSLLAAAQGKADSIA